MFRYASPKRKKRRMHFGILLIVSLLLVVWTVLWPKKDQNREPEVDYIGLFTRNMTFNTNYLDPPFNLFQNGWLINTTFCLIPNIPLVNPEVKKELRKMTAKDGQCETLLETMTKKGLPYFNGSITGLFYVEKQYLKLNLSALKPLNLKWNDISCGYQTIHRVEQKLHQYDNKADNKVWLSGGILINSSKIEPSHGFIKVTCVAVKKGKLENVTIYSDFHILAIIPKENPKLHKKLKFWQKCASLQNLSNSMCGNFKGKTPPNVLLIGVESTSRLNFRRQMPRLSGWLEKKLDMVEMRGYTKVGENTFPNFVPLLTSHFVEELIPTCMKGYYDARLKRSVDDCPFLWKTFSEHNYVTAHVEDCPGVQIFHYLKTGFVQSPADFYPRPWSIAAWEYEERNCVSGGRRAEQVLLQYIVDLIELLNSKNVPFFITSWFTQLTHYSMNKLQFMELELGRQLNYLKKRGLLNNTLVIIAGDHSYRYGYFRRTTTGWYEDKLPALWIRLPETITSALPQWKEALGYNANQLSTPFDLHTTMKSVLSVNRELVKRRRKVDILEGMGMRGLSLFKKLPDRSCDQAGVPYEYCACVPPAPYTGNSELVRKAAVQVMKWVNRLDSNCTVLGVNKILAFAVIKNPDRLGIMEEKEDKLEVLRKFGGKVVIGINTEPGHINYEAWLKYDTRSKEMFQLINSSLPFYFESDRDCIIE